MTRRAALSDEIADKTPGFGVGLHAARQIVRAHGGELSVESAPGRGATFSFALPGIG